MTGRNRRLVSRLCLVVLLAATGSVAAQEGTANGEWRHYAGDLASTRYSPLDQIDRDNFNELELVWRMKADNFGPQPEYNFESTPLMVDGVVYTTAGTRRAVVAVDAGTGEYLWMHRLDEGERGAARAASLVGFAGWRIATTALRGRSSTSTPGYQLIALDAATGDRVSSFGTDGIVDLMQNMDQEIDPISGEIGLHSTPMVAGDTIIIGAAHVPGSAPRSYAEHQGPRPRVRCRHRRASLDLPHDSGGRRVRQRHLAQ